MDYRRLGGSGVRVSNICLGSAWFGIAPIEEDVPSLVDRALDLGINFFDCANTYGNRPSFDRPGKLAASQRRSSEEMLGEALKKQRHKVIITSKVQEAVGSGPNDGGPNGGGLSRHHIRQQIERSLRRLQTDYIDVYYAHHFDPTTPLEESLRASDELIKEGKIRYYALSTFQSWQVVTALWFADRLGLNPPICLQMPYNLADRSVEARITPLCLRFGLTMTLFSPLGGGLLAGPQARSRDYVGMKRVLSPGTQKPLPGFKDAEVKVAEGMEALAAHWGHAPASVALAWLLTRPAVTAAIIGAESIAELEESTFSAAIKLDPEQLAALEVLVPSSGGSMY